MLLGSTSRIIEWLNQLERWANNLPVHMCQIARSWNLKEIPLWWHFAHLLSFDQSARRLLCACKVWENSNYTKIYVTATYKRKNRSLFGNNNLCFLQWYSRIMKNKMYSWIHTTEKFSEESRSKSSWGTFSDLCPTTKMGVRSIRDIHNTESGIWECDSWIHDNQTHVTGIDGDIAV
jgi:hypothetical protein